MSEVINPRVRVYLYNHYGEYHGMQAIILSETYYTEGKMIKWNFDDARMQLKIRLDVLDCKFFGVCTDNAIGNIPFIYIPKGLVK